MSFLKKKKKYLLGYPDKSRVLLIENFIKNVLFKKKNLLINKKEIFDLMSVCFSAIKSEKLNKRIKIIY